MLTKIEKIKLLLSVLGDDSEKILTHLKESCLSQLYAVNMPPKPSNNEFIKLIQDFIDRLKHKKIEMDNAAPDELNENANEETFLNDFLAEDIKTNEESSIEEEQVEEKFKKNLNESKQEATDPLKPELIASCLKKESLHVASFYISMISEEEKESLLQYFPLNLQEKVLQTKVQKNAFSETIFKELRQKFHDDLFGEDENDNRIISINNMNETKNKDDKISSEREPESLFSGL